MERKLLIAPLLILLALIAAGPVAAQSTAAVTAFIELPKEAQYFVGDPVELKLTVTHPADHHVIFPELEEEWGEFILKDQSAPLIVDNNDGTKSTTQILDARLFQPGTFDTPPLSLTVADGAGQLLEVLVPTASVTITSVLVEGDTELRDIKPQADLPYANLLPWLVAGALIIVLAILITIWRRRRQQYALVEADNRMPHEVALDELAAIRALSLPDEGRFKKHYTLVSETVRTYMGSTYRFPVLERTTGEIHTSLRSTAVPPTVAREFLSLLDESDLVKFSKFKPSVSDADQMLALAFTIVEETKPVFIESEPPSMNGKQDLLETKTILNSSSNTGVLGNGKYRQSEVKA
jgi:hypothetical protein